MCFAEGASHPSTADTGRQADSTILGCTVSEEQLLQSGRCCVMTVARMCSQEMLVALCRRSR